MKNVKSSDGIEIICQHLWDSIEELSHTLRWLRRLHFIAIFVGGGTFLSLTIVSILYLQSNLGHQDPNLYEAMMNRLYSSLLGGGGVATTYFMIRKFYNKDSLKLAQCEDKFVKNCKNVLVNKNTSASGKRKRLSTKTRSKLS